MVRTSQLETYLILVGQVFSVTKDAKEKTGKEQ